MKYGETLRQRSIPAWSHHNIDYDDIKHFIKSRTTQGKDKTITIPGRDGETLLGLEHALFEILVDQHDRIDLFVKSKAGEIQRRLDHAKKQLRQLSSRHSTDIDRRIPIGRLERYGKLEDDVLKVGDELRSLARFTSTQRTAFRKLLKKFKKWTGSTGLETGFREAVLDDPKSFTKLDLSPMLSEYSLTLHDLRSLYETRLQQANSRSLSHGAETSSRPPVVDQLQTALHSGSRVDFDTAVATVPLGEVGTLANYFVHPENVVELQLLLLQHMEYYDSRRRANLAESRVVDSPQARTPMQEQLPEADCFMLVADDLDRLAQEQSALTVNEREHVPDLALQRAKAIIRWNNQEDAVVSVRSELSHTKSASLKAKYVNDFFDKSATLRKESEKKRTRDHQALGSIRGDILKDRKIKPLYKISSCRTRLTGIGNGSKTVTIATLDTAIFMEQSSNNSNDTIQSTFPFALLQIRQEGTAVMELPSILDQSHLVERVRGFSLQHHALWQLYKPKKMSAPFWIPILTRDIRKLPPPALHRNGSVDGSGSASRTATNKSVSTPNSVLGITDGTTAVETENASSGTLPDILEVPPLKSFRKKRRCQYANAHSGKRYWSEYDHPEDDAEGVGTFVLYIDPDERSTLDRFFSRLSELFSRRQPEQEALLSSQASPSNDDLSDEEDAMPHQNLTYGTSTGESSFLENARHSATKKRAYFLPDVTIICLVASAALLIVAYLLETTSKHKYATQVDAGIVFAIICSCILAVVGFAPLLRRRDVTWTSLSLAGALLILEVVFSGYLLAWILG